MAHLKLRQAGATCAARLASKALPLTLLPFRNRLFTLFYHPVSDSELPHIAPLYPYKNTRAFERDLDDLGRRFVFPSYAEIVAHLEQGRRLPPYCCLLTFDDGLRSAAETIAPVLKSRGIPAIFFVNSAFIDNRHMFYRHKVALLLDRLADPQTDPERRARVGAVLAEEGHGDDASAAIRRLRHRDDRLVDRLASLVDLDFGEYLAAARPYLTSDELRALDSDGFTIGAHSHTHPYYAEIPAEEQIRESLQSVEFVKSVTGRPRLPFAFPFNDNAVGSGVYGSLRDAGVQLAFGTGGLRRDTIDWSCQRISADDPRVPIDERLGRAAITCCALVLTGRSVIRH